ncbi:hypothetical protein VTJ83DRAFT_4300 [Remersonia thermophila]|uniref:Amidohydrolase-related domain-containing protein n=1 Tax=Remersonia thermophila TaxID=72144 RepID=A0ABR4D9I2_9PEZI
MAARKTLYLGTFVHSKSLAELEFLHDGAVFVNESGAIVAIEESCDEAKAKKEIFSRLGWAETDVDIVRAKNGQFFFPGFIDTHIHASQYPNAGIFGQSTLLDWLNTYTFPLEASLADPAKARRVYSRVVRRTLAHGTTCAAYYATIDAASTNLLADLCFAAGQRALIGRVCMDQLSPDYYRDASPEAVMAATRQTIDHIRAVDPQMEIVRPIITPRFAPACSIDLMRQLANLANEQNLPIQTHISENVNEIALVKSLFPPSATGAAPSEDNGQDATSYAAVYDAAGLLTERTILAHAVHLTEGEARLVARRGAKVSHCPCSNSALGSGAARVRWFLDRGIGCSLGSDVSGGYSPSVLEAARAAVLVSRHVAQGAAAAGRAAQEEADRQKLSVKEVLYLATRGGAEAVGLAPKVGGFEVGMEWDAQLVGLCAVGEDGEVEGTENGGGGDDGNVDVFGWESWPDRIAKWVYTGDDRNTKKVWVKGRLVHERK